MPDTKITSNGNVQIWAVPVSGIANINAPTAAEINAGVSLDNAVAWEGTTFPANDASNDVDDRSIMDAGNATSRGYAQFAATLSLFRPQPGDTTSEYGVAWTFLKTPRVPVILVVRTLQGTAGTHTVAAAGQWVNLYQFISDTVNDNTEGEDSYKYIVNFSPQGNLAINTQVKNASAPTVSPASLSVTAAAGVNHSKPLRAVLGGNRATNVVTWTSADPTKATVSKNGVVTGVASGSTTVTANHPSASAASTTVAITIT
jgi:hypothetical protein